MQNVSIIVPVWNEEGSVNDLVTRIDSSFKKSKLNYEIIFIDDNSTDKTVPLLKDLSQTYPIEIHQKIGVRGKASSLLQGFRYAKNDVVAMIDADLQYPPEDLPKMAKLLNKGTDIVVAHRKQYKVSPLRKVISWGFQYFFTKKLHRLDHDAQSGMKVFKREVLNRIVISPSQWSFDLEFLLRSRDAGYQIASHDIVFQKRSTGKAKIKLLQAIPEIGLSSIKLRYRRQYSIPFPAERVKKDGEGFHYRGQEYIHHTTLPQHETAFHRLSTEQIIFITSLLFLFIAGLLLSWYITIIALVAALTFLYFLMLFFDFFMLQKGYFQQPEIKISPEFLTKNENRVWPKYTILCPLYKEWQVIPQFVSAMGRLDYPKNKLQVLLLLEEDDKETLSHISKYKNKLPSFVKIIIVPHSLPKTKPKACNYGLKFATGEYVVIYDAEDVPDPKQLKKAVLAFEQSDKNIVCLQAKLNFYNPHQNLLTRIFTAEYSLWFDLVLTGMQSTDAPIPLGGTSNHFRVEDLRRLDVWDAFNVTEDADLGMRLIKKGYRTAILESVTLEEANSNFIGWIKQRSRWIKGYMQTYLVHTRDLSLFKTSRKRHHKYTFQLVMGAKILSTLINPIMWGTTILYFAWRTGAAPVIERFFPAPVLYMGIVCFVFGNFLYMYYYMIGSAKRGHYELVKYSYLVPLYWITMSYAGWMAVVSLIRDPHYWEKTTHGFHYDNEAAFAQSEKTIGHELIDTKITNKGISA